VYKTFFKPLIDFFGAVVLIIVSSPVILLIAVILLFVNKGNPFFFQDRPGRNERTIRIIKFKSMTDAKGPDGNLLPDAQRMTKFGSFVRNTSLDELPQLFSVLNGDMSLVGPRPLLFKYLPLYSAEQRRRHEVKPGITGWAQVNGRNSISWTQKFSHDVDYVDKVSFLLDAKILWLTLLKVVRREGINQSEGVPMQPFNGTN
jgi:undecaprenyl phosphate N,N'-diacetylbacillosamine 1-phosphate transferase